MLTQESLNQFSGSENWYQHSMCRKLYFTDGVKHVADEGGAYWLIDAIASYQPRLSKQPMLQDMQFWTLKVKDNQAVLTCKADSGYKPAVTQNIEYTDFPLSEIEIWVERGSVDGVNECLVAMLPGER